MFQGVFKVTRICTLIRKCFVVFFVCMTQFEDFYYIPNKKGVSQNQILCLLHAGSFLFVVCFLHSDGPVHTCAQVVLEVHQR